MPSCCRRRRRRSGPSVCRAWLRGTATVRWRDRVGVERATPAAVAVRSAPRRAAAVRVPYRAGPDRPQDHDPCGRLAVEQQQAAADPRWQFERVIVSRSWACRRRVRGRSAWCWCAAAGAHGHVRGIRPARCEPIDESAGRDHAAGRAGEPRVDVALAQVGEAESLLVEPRGQLDRDAELAVQVPVAAGAREAAAEPAGEVGLQLPARVGGECAWSGCSPIACSVVCAQCSNRTRRSSRASRMPWRPARSAGRRSLVRRRARRAPRARSRSRRGASRGTSGRRGLRSSHARRDARLVMLLELAQERLELCDRVRIRPRGAPGACDPARSAAALLLKSWPCAPQSWQYSIVRCRCRRRTLARRRSTRPVDAERRQRWHAAARSRRSPQPRQTGPRSVIAAICPRLAQCEHLAVGSGTQRRTGRPACRAQ